MPRKWEPREMKLVAEYLAKNYSSYRSKTRVRLGQVHPAILPDDISAEDLAFSGVWRRWADAIVITPQKLILIEAAILADAGDISKLALYKTLIPHTPELAEYKNLDIELQLVYAIEDPLVVMIAREAGIKPVYFKPDWIAEYIATLTPNKQRATLTYPQPEIKGKK